MESVFICRSIEGHRIDDIQSSGFEVVEICSDVTESSGCDLLSDGWRADARQCLDALSAYGQADWL
ncbi:MAG: hypothetical protein OEY63_01445, partial [Gemmatimonadota bacterium]|nr:hypothetical protein [Gemmatimonadota bacterium]